MMTSHHHAGTRRGRSGITLTEILISIMIMGIGMISLATLFPLGLLRIRSAQRDQRSVTATYQAIADASARNIFWTNWIKGSPWFSSGTSLASTIYGFYDPWVQDMSPTGALPDPGTTTTIGGLTYLDPSSVGVYRGFGVDGETYDPFTGHLGLPYVPGEGLPVAFDPLWWAETYRQDSSIIPTSNSFRFANGIGYLRNDPNPGNYSPLPSAHGLQRLTTIQFFNPSTPATMTYSQALAGDVFSSPDDPVLQADTDANAALGTLDTRVGGSPILPLLGAGGVSQEDWDYTWMFTGHRVGTSTGTIYDGDVVVFHKRPFGYENFGSSGGTIASGERVVEAIWGYGTTITNPMNAYGYSPNDTTVLLRWYAQDGDPDVRVGGFIADVTYEQSHAEEDTRFGSGSPLLQLYPGQRCHWYRVVRKTEPIAELDPSVSDPVGTNPGSYRRMVVTVATSLKAKTLLTNSGVPYHVNAALVNPYVVNVFQKIFYSR
jgi:type II secretory pathway pseudopilin PulG